MDRRSFLATGAGSIAITLAGCTSGSQGAGTESTDDTDTATETEATGTTVGEASGGLSGTLTVGTYGSFVDAPSSSPGPWLKSAFEERHPDVTLEWNTPENALNQYIQRQQSNADIDADVYVGLKVPELVRIDENLADPLFEPVDPSTLSNGEHIRDGYSLDPANSVLPVFTGYCSFVYNGYEVSAPESLDVLTTPEYEGTFTVQNPLRDNTGLYFLLWTVKVMGEDGYLDYWNDLLANGTRVLDDWSTVYSAFSAGETPLITSFSTDQVFAQRSGADLQKHQVAFPGGHGYTNLSGIGKFAASEQSELADAFIDFMLSPDAQGKLAELNVSFPVTDHASVPPVFEEYAKEPPEPLLYTFDELRGSLSEWKDAWAREVASK